MTKPTDPVLDRWNQLRLGLCWASTILSPALAGLALVAAKKLPGGAPNKTAAIDNRGRTYVNTLWGGKLPDGEVRFVVLHECLHLILRHHERVGGRDPQRWGIAGDLVINDAIPNLGGRLGATTPDFVLQRDRDFPDIPPNLSAEEVYELLRDEAYDESFKAGVVGAGCSVEPSDGSGQPDPGDGAGAAEGQEGLSPGEWQNIAQSIRNAVKSASMEGGAALAALLHIPPSRVRWQALLRELAAAAASRAGRDIVTYNRKSRRSPRRIFLPGTRTNDVRLAVVIDSSGSMDENELAACVAETQAAVNAANVTAYLVVHDHEVRSTAWIKPGGAAAALTKYIIGRGGTQFTPAYDAVAEAKASFAAIVHFTDGMPCEPWPTKPRNCARAIGAITVDGTTAQVPVGWRVVPIETPGRT